MKKFAIILVAMVFCFGIIKPVLADDPIRGDTSNGASNSYPYVPGIGSLDQFTTEAITKKCQELWPGNEQVAQFKDCIDKGKSEQMGKLFRYFLYLMFALAGGTCVILIIIGGVGYIDATGKVEKLIRAKERLKRASLGLFIIISSWALLYLINPDLLLFKFIAPKPKDIVEVVMAPPGVVLSYETFSPKDSIEDVLMNMMSVTPAGNLEIEQPFLKALAVLDEAILVLHGNQETFTDNVIENGVEVDKNNNDVPGLDRLLASCKCGQSYSHIKNAGTLDFQPFPGMSPDDTKKYFDDLDRPATPQDVCLTKCDNCGTKHKTVSTQNDCVLNDVRATEEKDGEGKTYFAIEVDETTNDNTFDILVLAELYPDAEVKKWQEVVDTQDATRQAHIKWFQNYSIKYKIVWLQYIVPQLTALKPEFSVDQFEQIGGTLLTKAQLYMLSQAQAGIFQPEFEETQKGLEEKGFGVKTEKFVVDPLEEPGGEKLVADPLVKADKPSGFLAQVKTFFADRFAFIKSGFSKDVAAAPVVKNVIKREPSDDQFYIIKEAINPNLEILPYEDATIARNAAVVYEASRANLYAILADQTIEEIEKMTQDCLTSAFGQAKYDLPDNIDDIIRDAVEDGSFDYLLYELTSNSQAFTELIGQQIADDLAQQADGKLAKKCAESCGASAEQTMDDDKLDDWLKTEANENCVVACMKENIPPHLVSNTVADFLTRDLITNLPPTIEADLGRELKKVLEESEVIANLDNEMIELYNKVLHGALSESFADQVPALKKVLTTNIYGFLKTQLSGNFMRKLDGFLTFRVADFLKKKIHEEAEKIAKGLGNDFVNLTANTLDHLKDKVPDAFVDEKITQTKEFDQCMKFEIIARGYAWVPDNRANPGEAGTCRKLTAEEIDNNSLGIFDVYGMSYQIPAKDAGGNPTYTTISKQEFCLNAGYIWSKYTGWPSKDKGMEKADDKGYHCSEDQTILSDLETVVGYFTSAAGLKELGMKVLAGTVNFIEEFVVALTETITHTALAYIDVWVEDEVLYPMEDYLKQFSGLQDMMRNFLNSNVQDVIPQQIADTLNGNVDELLKNICDNVPPEPSDETARNELAKEDVPKDTFKLSLYGEKTWGGEIDVSGVTYGAAWKICDVSRHLHTTLATEIKSSGAYGAKVIEILNSKVMDLLPAKASEYLTKTPEEIIFEQTGLQDISNLVKGTPNDFICGRLLKVSGESIGFSGGLTLEQKCASLKKQRNISVSDYSVGITYPDVDPELNKDANQDLYRFYCPFIWGACQFPGNDSLPLVGSTVGKIAKDLILLICDSTNKKAPEQGCKQGICLGVLGSGETQKLQNDNQCPDITKGECQGCNFLTNTSLARSLIYGAVRAEFGPVETRTADERKNEVDVYCWFKVYFDKWRGDIDAVAQSRGINPTSELVMATKCKADIKLENVDSMDREGILRTIVSWRLKESGSPGTVAQALLLLPDGIYKPAIKGEATLLREAGKGEKKNILDKTPSQVFSFKDALGGLCSKIEKDYKQAHPDKTYEAIAKIVSSEQPSGVAYSMESLNRTTTAEVLNRLTEVGGISDSEKFPYLICQYLKRSPAEIFGLDQELMYYVRPAEYQILFELINEKLTSAERPAFLNWLLGFLYGQTPVSALNVAGGVMKDVIANPELEGPWYDTAVDLQAVANGNAKDVSDLAYYLGTPLYQQLEKVFKGDDNQEERLIDQVCGLTGELNGLCNQTLPINSSVWADIQSFLLKTPVDIIEKAMPWKLSNQGALQKACRKMTASQTCNGAGEYTTKDKAGNTLCCKQINSLMDLLGLYLPFMSQPYIDSLFNAAGLTDNFQNMIEQSNIIQDKVDGVYDKNIKKAVAGAIDKVVLEAPQELVKFIGSKLAQLVGLSAGDDIGKTMAGACKPMVGSCDTAKGEIQRTLADGVQECCDTGQALVCTNKCRPIGLEACKETSGEKQFNINGNKCCFDTQVTAGSDEECYKCRELVGDPAGGKCERDGELKPITRTDSAGKEIKLCCKPRAIDECQQVTAIEGMPELVCDIKGGEIFQNRKNASDETASFCCKAKPEEGSNGAIYNERFCCETITDCINDKFLKHMEMMKDYLLDGPPLSSLYDEEE